jgi:hypothetical protein
VRGFISKARGPHGLSAKRIKPSHLCDAFCDALPVSSLVVFFFGPFLGWFDKGFFIPIGLWRHSPFSLNLLLRSLRHCRDIRDGLFSDVIRTLENLRRP